jgi:Right handed beta helix region
MKWRISHLRSSGILGASVLIFASLFSSQLALGQSTQIIPPNRNFTWNPGMMSKGGVPNRTTICATLLPSGGEDSALIQAAINSCPSGQVVMLKPGTFQVNTSYVLINRSITLRGSGAGITILSKTNGAQPRQSSVVLGTNGIHTPVAPNTYTYNAQPIVIVGPSRWPGPDNSTSQSLTADGQQGAYSVTIASASGFAAGQFVLLDETSGASWQPVPLGFGCTDSVQPLPCPPVVWQGDRVAWNMHYPQQKFQDDNQNSNTSGPYDTIPGVLPAAMSWFSRTNRPTNEMKEVASVSGNTITFTSPLAIGYRASHSAQLTRYTLTGSRSAGNSIHVTNAGVENLSMYGGADGELRFEAAAYSWAKSVEITQWTGEGVAMDNAFRIELRDSYIHTGSWPTPGGAGYAISLADGSAEMLIENNIMIDTNKDIVMRSSGAGSVVGYNYADDPWDNNATIWQEVGLNASHMAGPHHVLFEGNYSVNFDSDYTHGNAIYLTVFRNVLTGQRRDFTDIQNVRAVGLAYGSWWDSFIGNILGRAGQMSGWSYTDHAMSCDASGNNCTGNNGAWGANDIWKLGYDPERWTMVPDPNVLSTVIRDGNYDFLTNSQRWHNTPGKFVIPNSMYLTSIPAFFGNNPWPWVNPTTGAIYTLPAKARYDAGNPNNQGNYTIAVIATATATVACGPPASFTATFSGVNLSAANHYETNVTVALTPNGGPPIVFAGPLTIPANTSGNFSVPVRVTGSLPSGVTFTLTGSATLRNDTANVNANTIPISFTNSNNQITCG